MPRHTTAVRPGALPSTSLHFRVAQTLPAAAKHARAEASAGITAASLAASVDSDAAAAAAGPVGTTAPSVPVVASSAAASGGRLGSVTDTDSGHCHASAPGMPPARAAAAVIAAAVIAAAGFGMLIGPGPCRAGPRIPRDLDDGSGSAGLPAP